MKGFNGESETKFLLSSKAKNMLTKYRNNSEVFHKETVRNFVPINGFKKFDFFRKTVIQKINNELSYFFEEQDYEFIIINLLNGCFSIFNQQIIEKTKANMDFEKTEFFEILFYTACFIVVKLQKPEQLPNLKEILIEHKKVDFSCILELEGTVMNSVKWNLNLQTPFEILICIFRELYPQINLSYLNEENCEINEINKFQMALSLIKYCINEFSIYRKYNQYIITISSILYMLKIKDEIYEMQIVKSFFEEDFKLIEQCFWDIDTEFNKEDELEAEQKGFVDPSNPLYVKYYFCEAEIKEKVLEDGSEKIYKLNTDRSLEKNTNIQMNPFAKNPSINPDHSINKTLDKMKDSPIIEILTEAKAPFSVVRISELNMNNNPVILSASTDKNHNGSFSCINIQDPDQAKNIVFAEITPIKKSILNSGHLFFSNVQKLNFSASGNLNSEVKQRNQIHNSYCHDRSESLISTAPEDHRALDYKSLPKKNLFSNSDNNLKFFEDNTVYNNLKLSSGDLIDRVDDDSSFAFDNSNKNFIAEIYNKSVDKEIHHERNKRINLLKNKRKKYSNRNLLLVANKNIAKIFKEDDGSQIEEEKENDFTYANKNIENVNCNHSFEQEKYGENFEINTKQRNKKSWNSKKFRNRKFLRINKDSGISNNLVV